MSLHVVDENKNNDQEGEGGECEDLGQSEVRVVGFTKGEKGRGRGGWCDGG